jgi:general secretion pathway protein K
MILWERFLRLIADQHESQENFEPNTIIDPLKDWLDSGDDEAITGLNGAESEYYQDLVSPYPSVTVRFLNWRSSSNQGNYKRILLRHWRLTRYRRFNDVYGISDIWEMSLHMKGR